MLERRIPRLRGPCAAPFTLSIVQLMGTAPLLWVWRCNMLAALIHYGKADAAKAHGTQSIWQVLYSSVELLRPGYAAQMQRTSVAKPSAQRNGGPPGACFRCGMYGHWARSCVAQLSTSQQMCERVTPIPVCVCIVTATTTDRGFLACRSSRRVYPSGGPDTLYGV